MKKISFLLCLFTTVAQLFSGETAPGSGFPDIRGEWGSDETTIYLDLDLENGLKFNDTYHSGKIDDGFGVEVRCLPMNPSCFISSDEEPLKEIIFRINVNYNKNDRLTTYLVNEQFIYENIGWFKSTKSNNAITFTGTLKNMNVDLSEDVVFYSDPKISNKGRFVFKKLN